MTIHWVTGILGGITLGSWASWKGFQGISGKETTWVFGVDKYKQGVLTHSFVHFLFQQILIKPYHVPDTRLC